MRFAWVPAACALTWVVPALVAASPMSDPASARATQQRTKPSIDAARDSNAPSLDEHSIPNAIPDILPNGGRGTSSNAPVERAVLDADSPWVKRVNTILRLDRMRGRKRDDVAKELAALGTPVIQPAFAILAGTVPGPLVEGSPAPPAGTPAPDVVILAALALLDPRDVARHVAAQVSGDATLEARVVAMHVLSEAGGEGGLDAWLDIGGAIPAESLRAPFVHNACEAAITRVLSRDTRAFATLNTRLAASHHATSDVLTPIVWKGVAGSRQPQGIRYLLSELPHSSATTPGRDRQLLQCLAQLVEATTGDLTDDEVAWVRPFALHEDPNVRREGILTLARVQAGRDYALFVDGLHDHDARIRDASRWALEHVSGAELGTDAAVWTRWFEDQWAWFQDHAERLHRAIEIRVPEQSLEAARQLSERRLLRHQAAREVVDLCLAQDPNLVRQACVVLREIGSPASVPGLIEALGSDDPSVRDAVRATLSLLTGLKLGPEQDAWRRALSGS